MGDGRNGPNVRFARPHARRRRSVLLAGSAALTLLVSACGGTSASSPSAQATVAASTGPLASATPVATPEVTASPSTSASPAAAAPCTPQPPTSLSRSWTEVSGQDGDYKFSRPADWVDISANLTIPTNTSVSPSTFAATGLDAGAKTKVDLVRSADGSVGVSAWALDKVNVPTADLFVSELAWLKTQPQMKAVIDDTLTACIDGSAARGFSSTWTTAQGDSTFVIALSRNGKMFETQVSTTNPAQVATFDELLRTWKWSEPEIAGPGPTVPNIADQLAATKFAAFGTAGELDQSGGGHPNPATFKSTFPTNADRIWIIYELDDGVADTVMFDWRKDGSQLATNSFDYTERTSFAWGWLTPDPTTGKFVPGNYEVSATLKTSGEEITLKFVVE